MGLMSRPFAALYDRIIARAERAWIGDARRELLAGLHGSVLELGAGTGANFQHYPPGVTVVAVEPNPHMLRRAAARAATAPVPVALKQGDAQRLPFPDRAFDAVVATFVFCSIANPAHALAEVRRVAKPGASLLLIEHVQAKAPFKRLILNLWNPVQQLLGDGCHSNRETAKTVRNAGFLVDEEREIARELGVVPYVRIRARVPT
jgi:ubiquinone/menaquinone biosynthesis C-methylase UbiE